MKPKNFWPAKETIIQAKQQPRECEKLITKFISKYTKSLNTMKTNNQIQKWDTKVDRVLKKEKHLRVQQP